MKKEDFLAVLGPLPKRVKPEVRVLSREDCGTYLREKISVLTEVGDTIPAYVLVPKGSGDRLPAVFCHHQHAGNFSLGKSEVVGLGGDSDQALAVELVARGFVVFAPDAIGFEERNWSGGDNFAQYHEFATRLVRGEALLAKVLHDISVGVGLPSVAPEC